MSPDHQGILKKERFTPKSIERSENEIATPVK